MEVLISWKGAIMPSEAVLLQMFQGDRDVEDAWNKAAVLMDDDSSDYDDVIDALNELDEVLRSKWLEETGSE